MKTNSIKGIVFFDVDGTLVDERSRIYRPTEKTIASVKKLRSNGYLTGVATGRAMCYIPDFGMDFDCYVTSNGAVAEYGGKIVYNNFIPAEKLLRLIDYFDSNDIAYNAENHDCCYYSEKHFDIMMKMLDDFNISPDAFYPMTAPGKVLVNKLMCVFDESVTVEKIRADIGDEFLVTRHHENNSADIDLKYMNKSVGMAALVEYFGIDIKNVYAFGDDGNDADMLKFAGCGIAMTPHAAVLDTVADMFTLSVSEDGISTALEKLGLI